MAMTGAGLKGVIIAALSALRNKYLNPADNHRLADFDIDAYNDAYWTAVSNAIVSYIQGNAKAVGTDTGGDSHNLDVT